MFLLDKTSDWYWVYEQDNPGTTWVRMRAAMLAYFSRSDFDEETREKLVKRVQGSRESFSNFSLDIHKLNCRWVNRLSERDILHRLFNNMHLALCNSMMTYFQHVHSFEDSRMVCSRFEKLWNQTGFDPRNSFERLTSTFCNWNKFIPVSKTSKILLWANPR